MKVIDTNFLVRLATNDVPEQTAYAVKYIQSQQPGSVLLTGAVLSEFCFVLQFNPAYRLERRLVNLALTGLLGIPSFYMESATKRAADHFIKDAKLDFVDCLLLAEFELRGHEVVSFDKYLLKRIATLKG